MQRTNFSSEKGLYDGLEIPPELYRRMAKAKTTTEAYHMLATCLLHQSDEEIVCHLHNPIVHHLMFAVQNRQRFNIQMMQFFSQKMNDIEAQFAKLQELENNEVFWEDVDDESED